MGTPLGPKYIPVYTIYLHGPFGNFQGVGLGRNNCSPHGGGLGFRV